MELLFNLAYTTDNVLPMKNKNKAQVSAKDQKTNTQKILICRVSAIMQVAQRRSRLPAESMMRTRS